jgi:hypothetical protein
MRTTIGPVGVSTISVSWNSRNVHVLEVFDATTLPPDGPVNPAYCYVIDPTATNGTVIGTVHLDWATEPLYTATGLVIAVSTNVAGCGQLTVDGPNNFICIQAVAP